MLQIRKYLSFQLVFLLEKFLVCVFKKMGYKHDSFSIEKYEEEKYVLFAVTFSYWDIVS